MAVKKNYTIIILVSYFPKLIKWPQKKIIPKFYDFYKLSAFENFGRVHPEIYGHAAPDQTFPILEPRNQEFA